MKNEFIYLLKKSFYLGVFNLKSRYKFSILGYLWALVSPISMLIVLSIFFGKVIKLEIQNYPLFILIAYFPWLFYTTVVNNSAYIFQKRKAFFKNSSLSPLIFPLSSFWAALFHFILTLPVLFLAAFFIYKTEWTWRIYLYFPLLTLLYSFFLIGIAFLSSFLSLFLKDFQEFLQLFLLIHFYLTPIFYPLSFIPYKYYDFYLLNPLAIFTEYYRWCFYGKTTLTSSEYLMYLFLFTIVLLIGSSLLLIKFSRKGLEKI